jgi:phenylpyruvate tautomerase PptA (4-oxalocrotonate tautomerase family)
LNKQAWELLGLRQEDIDQVVDEVEEKLWEVKGFSLEIQAER